MVGNRRFQKASSTVGLHSIRQIADHKEEMAIIHCGDQSAYLAVEPEFCIADRRLVDYLAVTQAGR